MKKTFFYLFLLSGILLIKCQKEISFETGGAPSHGSLLDDGSGDCLPKTVNGVYIKDTALKATNTIQVSVNVTKIGRYTIFSDTVNGYYFRATGVFSAVGSKSVTLKGYGKPAAQGVNNFLIQYDSSACNVAVTVLPAGSTAGTGTFTIQSSGTPAVCSASGPTGNYYAGYALTINHRDTFNVNVTAVGSYNVTTDTVNGMYFNTNGTGSFTATGAQKLVLYGQGTPIATGTFTFHVTAGSSTCSFTVTVINSPAATLGGEPGACTPVIIYGTYIQNVPLIAFDSIQVQISVFFPTPYNIRTDTVHGFSFSGSGLAYPGTTIVTLHGAGTPNVSGPANFTVTFGTSHCTFTVNVASTAAVGTLGGAGGACTPVTVNGSYTQGIPLTSGNTVQIQINVTTAGAYNIITNTVSGFSFSATGIATMGVQTITLNGNGGIPTASGPANFTVTFGTSTCSFTVNVAAPPLVDYFPRTTNSNWSYEFGGVSTDSMYINVISNTLSALSNTYNIFMQNDGITVDTSGYYRKSSSDYFHYVNLANYFSFDNDQWVEFNFIKDNQTAGFVWYTPGYTGSIGSQPITIRIKFTIVTQNGSVTLNTSAGSVTYPNTIVVKEQYEAQNGLSWVPLDNIFGYFKDYYSKNIGWIMDEYYDTSGTLDPTSTMRLRRYIVF